jgi:hypothetical protein
MDGCWVHVFTGNWVWLSQILSSLLQMSLTSHSIFKSAQAAIAHCKFIPPATPLANHMGVRGGQCGQQSVQTALPLSGTRTHDPHYERPDWSVPQCMRVLSHIPIACQALWIRQCPWASWCGHWSTARMRLCGRQATYILAILSCQ